MPSQLRNDILPASLTTEPVRITVRNQFDQVISGARKVTEETRFTPEASKSLAGSMDLARRAIEDRQRREGIAAKDKVVFTEEFPDFVAESELITFSVQSGRPGAFGEGRPLEADVRNLVPILREEQEDPENPGYKIATLGYWMDHVVRLTCFARTNKAANARAIWLQDVMREYAWWFRWNGVGRVLFLERQEDFILEENGQKLYGRPLDYFVRTEEVTQIRERVLEHLTIESAAVNSTSVLSRSL